MTYCIRSKVDSFIDRENISAIMLHIRGILIIPMKTRDIRFPF